MKQIQICFRKISQLYFGLLRSTNHPNVSIFMEHAKIERKTEKEFKKNIPLYTFLCEQYTP